MYQRYSATECGLRRILYHFSPTNTSEEPKKTVFCDLVESYRDDTGVPKHRIVVKLGQFDPGRIPYLKAAYNEGDPEEILKRELQKL